MIEPLEGREGPWISYVTFIASNSKSRKQKSIDFSPCSTWRKIPRTTRWCHHHLINISSSLELLSHGWLGTSLGSALPPCLCPFLSCTDFAKKTAKSMQLGLSESKNGLTVEIRTKESRGHCTSFLGLIPWCPEENPFNGHLREAGFWLHCLFNSPFYNLANVQ